MDGPPSKSIPAFLSPPRILIPTLVRSRDQWKDKASRRKQKLKLANLKIRDLTRSRNAWKLRHQILHDRIQQLQTERDRAFAQLVPLADAQKKSPNPRAPLHGAGSTPSPPSPSPLNLS